MTSKLIKIEKNLQTKEKEELSIQKYRILFKKIDSIDVLKNILSFVKFTPNKKFSQFGVIKKKEKRKLLTVFASVILYGDFCEEHLIDFQNLEVLILDQFKYQKFGAFLESQTFPNLRTLEIRRTQIKDSFFQKFRFPKLENLQLFYCKSLKGKDWESKNFENLTKIAIYDSFEMEDAIFKNFKNLKKLFTRNLMYFTGETLNDSIFNSLEELILCNSPQFKGSVFKKKEFKKLRAMELILINVESSDIDAKMMPNLEEMTINSCANIDDKILQQPELQKLKFLKLKKLPKIKGEWNTNILRTLESLEFTNCPNVSDSLFMNQFDSLQSLSLFEQDELTGVNWNSSISQNLKSLIIYKSKKIRDDLFKFTKLSKLSIGYLPLVKFQNWKVDLSTLDTLQLDGMKYLDDSFFQTHSLSNLKHLLLLEVGEVKGKDWKTLKNLETVEFTRLSIKDPFFNSQIATLQNLKSISLAFCPFLSGKYKLTSAKKIESVVIRECLIFSDPFFQKNKFKNLKDLEIFDSPNIKGKKWKKMKRLKMLEIRYCKNFKDDIFQSKAFPNLVKLRFLKMKNIDGNSLKKWKWNGFNSLKKINMNGKYIKNFDQYKKEHEEKERKKEEERKKNEERQREQREKMKLLNQQYQQMFSSQREDLSDVLTV